LCKSDITTKNKLKEQRFQKNLRNIEHNIALVEERDRIRNWQPPIKGDEIMNLFDLKPGKEIGIVKTALKDAILDGIIPNNYNDALKFVIEQGKKLGLQIHE
jgi:hypothetical protein